MYPCRLQQLGQVTQALAHTHTKRTAEYIEAVAADLVGVVKAVTAQNTALLGQLRAQAQHVQGVFAQEQAARQS